MSKSELVSDLIAQRDAILSLYDALSDSARTAVRTPEGWNNQDLMGHFSFWEQYTLKCMSDTLKNGRPTPVPPESVTGDLNARATALRKSWSWQRVRAEYENTHKALIQQIDALGESELQFYVPSPWPTDKRSITLETIVREEVLAHGTEHLVEIKEWVNADH